MPFGLAVHQDEIGWIRPIASQNNGAIPRAIWSLDSLGEVDFAESVLATRTTSDQLGISAGITINNLLIKKTMAES